MVFLSGDVCFHAYECVYSTVCVVSGHSRSHANVLMSFVETADCETDGYLSSSGLQDPLEAGSFNTPATPPSTHADTPTANGFPIPALRFPSVSGLNKGPVIKVESAGGGGGGGRLSRLYETSFINSTLSLMRR